MSFSIQGSTALVTGANRGIGLAIVQALLEAGVAKVYATARRDDDLSGLRQLGDKVVALQLDVTHSEQIQLAAAQATDVQLLINNAGYAGHYDGAFTDPRWLEAGRQEMEVNVFGTLAVTQAFAPVLAANGGGAVVNLNSVASFVNFPILAAYSASKAAAHSITQATRAMLRVQGTQVFGVYPGPIDTRMAEGVDMQKTPPAEAGRAIVAGIQAGTEEIFPDPTSQQLGAAYLSGPKELEDQLAAA